jgi:hypothetical protein
MAVKDGKIIELGPERQILNRYRSDNEVDALGKNVYPGFSDAHTHLLLLAQERLSADLKEVKTIEQTLVTLEKYHARNNRKFIIANGILFDSISNYVELSKKLTTNFRNIPVYLITKDAQTAILNEKAMEQLAIPLSSNGIVSKQHFSKFPKFSNEEITKQLFDIQDELFQFGIIAVHEMGWSFEDYQLFKSVVKSSKWKLNISAYLLPSAENKELLKQGIIKGEKIQIRGLHVLIDGDLNSKTAFVSTPYNDGTSGKLNYSEKGLDSLLLFAYEHELQLAAHTAGDMGATFFLNRIKALKLNIDNLKWRIEDLQKINPTVLALLTELHVIPSIQPYLAVSNAELIRLVVSKIDNSFYAYKSLLKTNGLFAIGSGLPIEAFNPFEIIWAANSRKKIDNIGNPFNYSEKLEKNDLIKAYTIYNAQLVDLDETLGVLEKNKPASFFISEFPINSAFNSIYNFANQTYIKSKKVYSVE